MTLFGQRPAKDTSTMKPVSRVEPPLPQPGPPEPMRGGEPMTPARFSESVVASGLTIEGKIEGTGNIRVAGRFKGSVNVKGELTIEAGAVIDGEVKADTLLVVGEVHGSIVSTSRVELRESGALIGDLKAGSLTVVAGSKMRGHVEFGWKDTEIERHVPPETKAKSGLVR